MKNILFQLKNQLFRPHAMRFAKQLSEEAKLSEPQRSALVLNRMRRIVSVAYEHSPFYKKKYTAAGVHPRDINSVEDYSYLPPVTKDELRTYLEQIKCNNIEDKYFVKSSTGGSTGTPVSVYHDRRLPSEVFGWMLLNNWGVHISDNAAFLERYNPTKSRPFLNRAMWWPTKRAHLDVSVITEESLTSFYYKCRKIMPVYIEGYVGAVNEFSCFLQERGWKLPSVKLVWTTSAPLSTSVRLQMEQVFNCPVYNQYGCCEVYWIAAECSHHIGLHYFDTSRHFDIVDNDLNPVSDGTYGELLLTDLLNEAFPIIRYRNGDSVCKLRGACPCGSKYPLIGSVNGRVSDVIRFRDGSFIPGDFLTTIFDDDPEVIKEFQVVQKRDYSLIIKYIPSNVFDCEARIRRVVERLTNRLSNHGILVSTEATTEIPHDRGKMRFIISEIDQVAS